MRAVLAVLLVTALGIGVGQAAGLPLSGAVLQSGSDSLISVPSSDPDFLAHLSYVRAADATKVAGATIDFTCTPGPGERGRGLGPKDQGFCPPYKHIDVTLTLYGGPLVGSVCTGSALFSGSDTGVSLPGTASFDFVPDIAIIPIECAEVSISS